MPRLLLVPLLLTAVAVLGVPAEASASCGGATRILKREICPPSAHFVASATQVQPGAGVDFDASGSSVLLPRTIVQYAWNFGDGTPEEVHGAGDPLTSHTFATRGRRTVELRVTDSDGLVARYTVDITVSAPPTANLLVSDTAPLSLTNVTVDASGSTDPDGEPLVGYEFDLDGAPGYETASAVPSIIHSFTTSGARTVRVRVRDADGAVATDEEVVTVGNRAPTAAVVVPNVALTGTPAELSADDSEDPDGSVVQYEWDLDGAPGYEVDGGTSPLVTHTWSTAGSHAVGVRVTDNAGAVGTATATLVVKTAPTAALSATPQQPLPGETVALNASGSSDPDGPLAAYTWDLDGDGVFERATGTTATTTTTFPAAGTVTVRVRVADADGLTATAAATVTIKQPISAGGGSGMPTGGGSATKTDAGGSTATTTTPAGTDTTKTTTRGDTAGGGATGAAGSPGATTRGADAGTTGTAVATLDGKTIQRLRSILKSGLRLACRGTATTRCAIRVEVDKATAKRLRLGRATRVATTTLRGQRSGTAAVKLSATARGALARARSVRLLVKGTATAADGSTSAISRVVVARR